MTDQRPADSDATYVVVYDSHDDKPGCGTHVLILLLGSGLLAALATLLPRMS